MPKTLNVAYDLIGTLFNPDGSGKEDAAYVAAYAIINTGKNKNDVPFTKDDIRRQPTLDEFDFAGKDDFVYTCELQAKPIVLKGDNWDGEKIVPTGFVNPEAEAVFRKSQGVVYMLTCVLDGREYIVKFGQTRKTFKERLASYNCGVINNIRTASTTNIKILQSFVACNVPFKLYLLNFGADALESFEWHGVRSGSFANAKSLAYENIIVNEFADQFGKKPLANVQTKI